MNKVRERAIVEGFVRWGGHPGLTLKDIDRERHDALVAHGTDLIGLEVTAVTEVVPRQRIAPQRWTAEAFKIVQVAKTVFESRNPTRLVVRFEMRPRWLPPNRAGEAVFAQVLASLVEQILTSPPSWPYDKEPYTLRDPHPDVSWMYVCRTPFDSHWQPSIVREVCTVSEQDLLATIARKEVELPAYRQAAPTVWLLVDCDVSGQGNALDVPNEPYSIPSTFDAVYCCGFGMWQWVQVSGPTQPAAKAG